MVFQTLDWKTSKGDIIGFIIVTLTKYVDESQESLASYIFFGTSTVFILPDMNYIDKIIKNVLKHVPHSMDYVIRVHFILPILVSL